jgi:hypothetical protein
MQIPEDVSSVLAVSGVQKGPGGSSGGVPPTLENPPPTPL